MPHAIVTKFNNLVPNLNQWYLVLLQFVDQDEGSSDDDGMLCE